MNVNQSEISYYSELPEEIWEKVILPKLRIRAKLAFAATCKKLHANFFNSISSDDIEAKNHLLYRAYNHAGTSELLCDFQLLATQDYHIQNSHSLNIAIAIAKFVTSSKYHPMLFKKLKLLASIYGSPVEFIQFMSDLILSKKELSVYGKLLFSKIKNTNPVIELKIASSFGEFVVEELMAIAPWLEKKDVDKTSSNRKLHLLHNLLCNYNNTVGKYLAATYCFFPSFLMESKNWYFSKLLSFFKLGIESGIQGLEKKDHIGLNQNINAIKAIIPYLTNDQVLACRRRLLDYTAAIFEYMKTADDKYFGNKQDDWFFTIKHLSNTIDCLAYYMIRQFSDVTTSEQNPIFDQIKNYFTSFTNQDGMSSRDNFFNFRVKLKYLYDKDYDIGNTWILYCNDLVTIFSKNTELMIGFNNYLNNRQDKLSNHKEKNESRNSILLEWFDIFLKAEKIKLSHFEYLENIYNKIVLMAKSDDKQKKINGYLYLSKLDLFKDTDKHTIVRDLIELLDYSGESDQVFEIIYRLVCNSRIDNDQAQDILNWCLNLYTSPLPKLYEVLYQVSLNIKIAHYLKTIWIHFPKLYQPDQVIVSLRRLWKQRCGITSFDTKAVLTYLICKAPFDIIEELPDENNNHFFIDLMVERILTAKKIHEELHVPFNQALNLMAALRNNDSDKVTKILAEIMEPTIVTLDIDSFINILNKLYELIISEKLQLVINEGNATTKCRETESDLCEPLQSAALKIADGMLEMMSREDKIEFMTQCQNHPLLSKDFNGNVTLQITL